MEKNHAISAFAALAHDIRLDIFRLLIKSGAEGIPAGAMSDTLGIKPNTLSNNLTVLVNARLIKSVREGRSVRYFAEMSGVTDLLTYLLEDCCGGSAEMCQPIVSELTCCS